MKTENSKNEKMQTLLSILTLVIGLVLMIYMIIVEDEPGAIPLLLIVAGATWFFITRYRARLQNKDLHQTNNNHKI